MERQTLSRERINSIMARFERRTLGHELSTEERLRRVVRATKRELVPEFVRCMQALPPERKLANANSLFVMARDALYHQELRRGLAPSDAWKAAMQHLLSNDVS